MRSSAPKRVALGTIATFLALLMPSFVAVPASAASATLGPALMPAQKPNVVIMLLDDFPAMDHRVLDRLPNIKQTFLDHGEWFTNYWANFSLCCPGRAALLTGQRDDHNGMMKNDARLFDPTETIATELQGEGYYTGIVGKYFNRTGLLASKTPPGWNYLAISNRGQYYDYPLWVNGVLENHGHAEVDYSTDVLAQKTVSFLAAAPSDQPLFAYLTPYATHASPDEFGVTYGMQPVPPPRFRGDPRCTDIPPWKPASYDKLNTGPVPEYVTKMLPMEDPNGFDLTKSCESLLAVDEWLGQVTDTLKAQGRYDNTIFILSSDNGMGWGAHRIRGKIAPYTAQVPLYISWPAVMGATPTENSTLLSNIDVAPTLCDIAGCEMGPFNNGFGVDGESFAGLLDPTDFASVPSRNSIVVEGVGGKVPYFKAILTGANNPLGQWLFVRYRNGSHELYDMSGGQCADWQVGDPGDPCMLNNLTQIKTGLRRKLGRGLNKSWASHGYIAGAP